MGQPIGKHVAGFAYSGDLSGHGGNWTFENMDAWLASPKKFAAGTKMSFAGLSKPEDRANVIVYLNSLGANLPLPKVEAAPAAEGAPAEGAPAADASGAVEGPAAPADAKAAGGAAMPAPEAAAGGDKSTAPVAKP
jgi:cytochrome c